MWTFRHYKRSLRTLPPIVSTSFISQPLFISGVMLGYVAGVMTTFVGVRFFWS